MSAPDDDLDMDSLSAIDDRTMEDILQGRIDRVPDRYRDLAAATDELRHATTRRPEPDAALRELFTHGAPPVAVGATARTAQPVPLRARLRPVLARAAGLSLAVKLGLAGAAVAATAVGGAGAAGVLPPLLPSPPAADPDLVPVVDPPAPELDELPPDTSPPLTTPNAPAVTGTPGEGTPGTAPGYEAPAAPELEVPVAPTPPVDPPVDTPVDTPVAPPVETPVGPGTPPAPGAPADRPQGDRGGEVAPPEAPVVPTPTDDTMSGTTEAPAPPPAPKPEAGVSSDGIDAPIPEGGTGTAETAAVPVDRDQG